MMPRGWMVASTLFALAGLPIGAGSGAAASPSVAALSLIASPPPALPPANPNFAISDLGTLGGETSSASSLNDLSQVVGSSLISAGAEHAFLYSAGRMSDLGTLGGPTSVGTAINAIGQVVGNSFTAVNSAQHAFLYSGGRMSDLGTLGGANSVSIGINALGQAAGNSFISGDAAFHAL